jgi:hypothetical protein
MEKTLGELSTKEFEQLVERTIDRRFEVWLTQLADALTGLREEENAELLRHQPLRGQEWRGCFKYRVSVV